MRISTEERFWRKVEIGGDDECWRWLSNVHRQGYGFFKWQGRNQLAHRVAYELTTGKRLPPGVKLLHACDNPSCVNPNHLKPGTQKENTDDMVAKGRHVGASLLTDDQVRAIRQDTRTNKEIAAEYGLAPNSIYYIRTGRNYIHVK